jgi:MutS domain V
MRVAHYEQLHIRVGNMRLALVLVLAFMAWAAFREHLLSDWWTAVPIVAFVALGAYHSRILRARDLAQRAVVFYKDGLARIEDRGVQIGSTGERFNDPHHVYAADLDVFGKSSLFQLLSTARTRMGEDTLAQWLLAPSTVERICERHAAVSELRDQLDLREELAILGEDAGVGVHPEALLKWAEAPNQLQRFWLRWFALSLAVLAVSAVAVWAAWGLLTPLVLVIVVEGSIALRLRKAIDEVLHKTENAFHDLDLLSGVLSRLESHTFEASRLRALKQQLSSSNVPSSQAIARLRTLVDLIASRHNVVLRVLDAPLMYSVQVAFAAERWRGTHGSALRSWVTAAGEIEALLSLAAFSFEHPADPFPEFTEGTAMFESVELGHPLVPAGSCVPNNVSISGETRVLLVSGSNMSGKSTLLRAVGVNIVLAMAGAPVRARSLRLTPLQVGASIRVNDSLKEGSSRFYAEITRLRQILDLAAGKPRLIFLLDELLQGTNSKDRRVGAEGIVRALVSRHAIGLVSTHDLALTDIGEHDGELRNVHFQDELKNGRITFTYKLQEGVVTKSNGLELMRSVGLDV